MWIRTLTGHIILTGMNIFLPVNFVYFSFFSINKTNWRILEQNYRHSATHFLVLNCTHLKWQILSQFWCRKQINHLYRCWLFWRGHFFQILTYIDVQIRIGQRIHAAIFFVKMWNFSVLTWSLCKFTVQYTFL